ncbi:MAG: mannonate dehydratase [Pseudomonadota bacterium]
MYVGTQYRPRNDDDLRLMAQLGVRHVCIDPPGDLHGQTRQSLEAHVERIASFGLILDMIELPMRSRPVEDAMSPNILLGREPGRTRELDSICRLIEACGAVGIPAVKYNFNIIGIPRTPAEDGRGGSKNAAFRWEKTDQSAPPGLAGVVDEEENWARIEHFLAHVVPVAERSKVRLACHPHDPYTPPGYRGVTRVLGTVAGLKRFVELHENPYHGLNFCQGTVAEMLDDPAHEISDVIRWFGSRAKIFNVHFRNIRGGKLSFMETFPDEGDMDMVSSLKLYQEVGYPYMVMPDHAPKVSGPDPDGPAFAFCYGWIVGAMQSLGMAPHGPDGAPMELPGAAA